MSYIIVNYVSPIVSILISVIACIFTILMYRKSINILDAITSERKYLWNKEELENLFSKIHLDSINSFMSNPYYISDYLKKGLRIVDLDYFQFDGKEEADTIKALINGLDSLFDYNWEQTPSGHWAFKPLLGNEPFDVEKETKMTKEIENKARELIQLFKKTKQILLKYHVNIRELNDKAMIWYNKEVLYEHKITNGQIEYDV